MNVRVREHVDRLYTAAGAATLALTAAPWLTKTVRTERGSADRYATLWGMLPMVDSAIFPLAVVAVLIITGFGVAAVVWRADGAGSALGFAALSWAAVITAGSVIALIDGGFRPGSAAWMTAVIMFATAVAATGDVMVRDSSRESGTGEPA